MSKKSYISLYNHVSIYFQVKWFQKLNTVPEKKELAATIFFLCYIIGYLKIYRRISSMLTFNNWCTVQYFVSKNCRFIQDKGERVLQHCITLNQFILLIVLI